MIYSNVTNRVPRPPPPLEQDRWGTSGIDEFPSQLSSIIRILRLVKSGQVLLAHRKYPHFVLNNHLDIDCVLFMFFDFARPQCNALAYTCT